MARSLTIGGRRVLVYLGRVHLYEGNPPQAVVHGVRTAIAAGATVVVLTNAAGGINASYRVGQPVLISDHLNLTGRSPLSGPPPPDGYPPRFADLTEVYSARLRALARASDPGLAEGVYAALPGPHYETPAEIRMLRTLGADLVGMSTALEAIAARHLGAEVLAISLVTNLAAGLADHGLDHAEVIAAGAAAAGRIGALLASILPQVRDPHEPATPVIQPAGLRSQVEAWIREDPDPGDQAELRALLAAGEQGGEPGRTAGRARRPVRRPPAVRHGGAARPGGGGAEPDEPGGGQGGDGGAGRWLREHGPGAPRRPALPGAASRQRSSGRSAGTAAVSRLDGRDGGGHRMRRAAPVGRLRRRGGGRAHRGGHRRSPAAAPEPDAAAGVRDPAPVGRGGHHDHGEP